jgi:hypothetical protein
MSRPRLNLNIVILAPMLIVIFIFKILLVDGRNASTLRDYEAELRMSKALSGIPLTKLSIDDVPKNVSPEQAEGLKKLNEIGQVLNERIEKSEIFRKKYEQKYQYLKAHPPELESYADYVVMLLINVIVLSVHLIRVFGLAESDKPAP